MLKPFAKNGVKTSAAVFCTMNRIITKFYNGDDVNVIAAVLRLTKMKPTSVYKGKDTL